MQDSKASIVNRATACGKVSKILVDRHRKMWGWKKFFKKHSQNVMVFALAEARVGDHNNMSCIHKNRWLSLPQNRWF